MHWSLWGVSQLSLAKLVNCNQILGHVADQDCIEFIDSILNNASVMLIIHYFPENVFVVSISGYDASNENLNWTYLRMPTMTHKIVKYFISAHP